MHVRALGRDRSRVLSLFLLLLNHNKLMLLFFQQQRHHHFDYGLVVAVVGETVEEIPALAQNGANVFKIFMGSTSNY